MKCDELKAEQWLDYSGEPMPCYPKAKVDAAIAELKEKLEDAKATAYAESVDAGMENRRLKRALYKACANWAHHRVFVRYKTNETAWENVERKCRAKAEQYQ